MKVERFKMPKAFNDSAKTKVTGANGRNQSRPGTESKLVNASEESAEKVSLPEGFNGGTNIDEMPLTLESINAIFKSERAMLAKFQGEKAVLSQKIDALERDREAAIGELGAKDASLSKLSLQIKEMQTKLNQQQLEQSNVEKQFLDTRLKLQAVQLDFDKLDKLSQDFGQVRDQRDALVRALETAEKEKQQLTDKLAAEKEVRLELETKQLTRGQPGAHHAAQISGQEMTKNFPKFLRSLSKKPIKDPNNSKMANSYGQRLEKEFPEVDVIDLPPSQNDKVLKHYESIFETQCSLIQHERSHIDRLNLTELQDGYKSSLARLQQREQKILLLEQSLHAKPKEVIVLTPETPTQLSLRKQEMETLSEGKQLLAKQLDEEKERHAQKTKQIFELQESYAAAQSKISELKNLNGELLQKMNTLKLANQQELQRQVEQHERVALKLKETNDNQSNVLKNLQKEFDKLHRDYIELSTDSDTKRREESKALQEANKKLKNDLNSLQSEFEKIKLAREELQQRNDTLEKQVLDFMSLETVNKTLTAGLAKVTADKCQLQLEVDRLEAGLEQAKEAFNKDTSNLEAFVFSLKQKLSAFLETENQASLGDFAAKSSFDSAKSPEQEKNLLALIRKDTEALVINQAFVEKAKKDKDTSLLKSLTLERDRLEALKRYHEDSLLTFYENKKVSEILSAELQALKQFKSQFSGLASTVQKAQQSNKIVLVTPQGVVTTTMADLKKELLNVNHKRESAELDIPLPPNWSRSLDPDGRVFYQLSLPNGVKSSQWNHPGSSSSVK